jgi:hypothetical protein
VSFTKVRRGPSYRIEDVRQMVTYRRLTHGWQFLFLGPESALDYALSIGIPRSNFAGFKTTSEGLGRILDRLGKAVKAYARGRQRRAVPGRPQTVMKTLKEQEGSIFRSSSSCSRKRYR